MAKKSTPNGMNTVVEGAKPNPLHNRRAGDKSAAAKAPAKTKPAAKTEAPAKAAAPAKTKPAVKAEAPAKAKPAAKAEAPAKVAKAPDTTKYVVADTTSVKRGFLAEYVEKAHVLKVFTRDALEAEFGGRIGSPEAQKVGTYFPYAVGKGIFAAK